MRHTLFFLLTVWTAGVLAQDNSWEEDQRKGHLSRSYTNMGREFAVSKQIDSAIFYFKKALHLDSSKHDVSYAIAGLFGTKQEVDSVIKYYTLTIAANPKFTDAVLGRGIAFMKKSNYKLALEDFDNTIQLNSMYDSVAYPNRALAKMNLGKFESAIADFNKAIEFHPNDYSLWNDRGGCKLSLGNLEGALKDFNKTLQLKPNHSNGLINRAQVFMGQNNPQPAINDLEKYMVDNPNSSQAHFQIGLLYHDVRDFNKTLVHLNKAEELGVGLYDLYFFRGKAYYYLAKDTEAIANFEKTLSIQPEFAEAYFYMGVCKNSLESRSGCEDIKKAIAMGFKAGEKAFHDECSD